ncbi:MAG: hypothetical protein ACP59X_02695 [Solidesulfovibrio sp. DCME]|uniref:hypothetical protein n=1 Tax=Solidesulfovibrio sp. DCME TaxID=3447380 RepID=UPI003D0C30C6
MNGTLIASTPRGSMQPLAYQGILATDCHHQIVTILRSRLGDSHVLLFAEPAFDPGRDIVDWYTPVQGTPIRLIDLPEDRQSQVRGTLLKMAADIQTQARQLKNTGDNNRVLSGSIIELALQYPGEDCIYLVGEQPVIVCWGFAPATAGAMPQDLSRLAPMAAPAAAAKPVSEPAPPAVPAVATPPAEEAIPVLEPAPARRRLGCLPALLGLLLLGLLLFFLWKYGILPRSWFPFLAFDRPTASLAVPGDAEVPGGLEAALARRDALRRERDGLQAGLIEKAGQCPQPGPSAQAAPGKELQVPASAGQSGDLSFLQGVWRCDADLSTPQDPVIVEYLFDTAGKGQITVKTTRKICTAGVNAAMDGAGALRMESDATIPCSTGSPIDGQRVVCVGKGAQTTCEGVNVTSKSNWKAKFYKF